MTSLLLHVGLHKTATTSFQGFLQRHDAVLASCGCLYPRSAKAPGSQHALLPGCYFPGHPFLPRERSCSIDHYLSLLAEELDQAPYWLCVLSSEVFTELLNHDRNLVRDLISRLSTHFREIVILLTLRDLPQLAYSDLKNRLRDISLGLRPDFAFAAPLFYSRIEKYKFRECEMWRNLGFKVVERSMDGVPDPVGAYFQVVADMLPPSARRAAQAAVSRLTALADDRNSDPFAELEYLILILSGLKLAGAGRAKSVALDMNVTARFLCNVKAAAMPSELNIESAQMIALLRCLHASQGDLNCCMVMEKVGFAPASAEYVDGLSNRLVRQLAG